MEFNNQELKLGLYQLSDVVIIPSKIEGLDGGKVCMDKKNADYLWRHLKSSLIQIQRKHYSKLKFEELYKYCYYLVLNKYGGVLYSGLQDVIAEHITEKMQSKVLANLNGNFLYVINRSWDHFQVSLSMMKDVLQYMDRMYVSSLDLDDVYTMGLKMFKDLVVCYGAIQTFLQETLLELVLKERQGQTMDRIAFKNTTKMLMVLGNTNTNVYQENFEVPFLTQSVSFYRLEGEQLLQRNNASFYLRRVDARLYEEIERSKDCFDESTTPQIVKVLEDELIKAHMKVVVEMENSGVVYMMQNQLTEDLACMYQLLSRVSDGLNIIFDCISRFLRQQGEMLVRGEDSDTNAIIYVQNLIRLKDNIDFYLHNSFSNDKLCKRMIAFDFEHILNINSRSPEYLSLFVDDRLKKTVRGMTDEDKTILLEKTMVLFRFLQDKDLFEQYYRQNLAKRLIISKTVNEDNEKSVIIKFKTECGLQYTRKMEGMFRDMWNSSTLTEEFQKFIADSGNPLGGMSISMRVLTAFYWPGHTVPPRCSLPLAPHTAFETFRQFYLGRHCGRQLTLLPQLGLAELEARFDRSRCDLPNVDRRMEDGETRLYTLHISTYQMCVLMLFNERSRWEFEELQKETNIGPKDLIKTLQSLIMGEPCQRILIKHPESKRIESGDSFLINTEFTSKAIRVKIPPFQQKYDSDSERQDTVKRVNDNRIHEVDAAITRLLKATKVMNYDSLMAEVIKMLSPRFIPSREAIKTRIEVLIERGYIARNADDRRVYEYIA